MSPPFTKLVRTPLEWLTLRGRAQGGAVFAGADTPGATQDGGMPRFTSTWILLMDGSRGRILVQETPGASLRRAFSGGFTAKAEHELCTTVAEFVGRAVSERQLERLILVAPPEMLKDLRTLLSPQALARVKFEVGRDWIDLPDAEIEARLGDALLSAMASSG